MFSYSLLYGDIAAGSFISFRASFDIGSIVCRWENGVELSFETTSDLRVSHAVQEENHEALS